VRRLIRPALLLIVAGSLSWWFWSLRAQPAMLPQVTLNPTDGAPFAAHALLGKPLVISFWSISCSVCLQDRPKLAALHRLLQRQGGTVIAVNMPYDPPSAILALLAEQPTPYPDVLDVRAEVNQAFGGIDITPTRLYVDRQGKIVRRATGELDLDHARETLAEL
jgi:thiol-disulfide isomerase/thioredoxin